MKRHDQQWLRLTAAAVDARDFLRGDMAQKLGRLAKVAGPDASEALARIRGEVLWQAESLRTALKGRGPARPRERRTA